MPRRGRDTSADTFSAVPHEPWIMGLEMRPNRYGGAGDRMLGETNGDLCCRHNVPLWKICKRCNQLLSWVRDPELYRIDNPFSGDPETNGWTPELPTLIGTGDE